MSVVSRSKFVHNYDVYMPDRCKEWSILCFGRSEQDQQGKGNLLSEFAQIQVVPGSKFVQNYDVYMPNKCNKGQYFGLVALSKTKKER